MSLRDYWTSKRNTTLEHLAYAKLPEPGNLPAVTEVTEVWEFEPVEVTEVSRPIGAQCYPNKASLTPFTDSCRDALNIYSQVTDVAAILPAMWKAYRVGTVLAKSDSTVLLANSMWFAPLRLLHAQVNSLIGFGLEYKQAEQDVKLCQDVVGYFLMEQERLAK